MNEQEKIPRNKSIKASDTQKSFKTIFSQIISIFIIIKDFFIWITNNINNNFSKLSIITQFAIIIIPISIIFFVFIFFFHLKYYDHLFLFNYYKGVKIEFLDNYITEIEDLSSELEIFIIKESYIDLENILFFDIYFRELASLGLLDDSTEITFPEIHDKSENIYNEIDEFYKSIDFNNIYSVPEDQANNYIDKRNDSLKELAKIYFYMLPIITYGAFFNGINIYKTYLVAYEFNENYNVKNKELYFSFPKASKKFNDNDDNFLIINGYLNPLVSKAQFTQSELINNTYYDQNYFIKLDYDFRISSNLKEKYSSNTTFGHINKEYDSSILKSLIINSLLNINKNNKHYVIEIIYYLEQKNIIEDSIEYSAFIIRNGTFTNNVIKYKYSDNLSCVISQGDYTECSLNTIDTDYFHYGLHDKNNNFLSEGISFDSFNLQYLSNPINYYSTIDGFNYDLKHFSSYFLYAKLFQNIESSNYIKKGDYVNIFSDEIKVKNICNELNLTNYIEYIKEETDIDCWDTQNELFYNEGHIQEDQILDIYITYPYCICLPLYCLNNYKNLKKDNYKFSENNLVSKINLPDKCQYKFQYYLNEKEKKLFEQSLSGISKFIFYLFISKKKAPQKYYIKIKKENLTQLKGYYLLVFSEIKSRIYTIFYFFFNIEQKIEIITTIIPFLLLIFTTTIFIIYRKLKKFSNIITEFTQQYENFIYDTRWNNIDILHQEGNSGNNNKKEIHDKNNENLPLLQNDNSLTNYCYNNENNLIEDLFSIFCKYYNINQNQLNKYYLKRRNHETKYQIKIKLMKQKNELFNLLCMFSIYAPIFRLNLSLEYKMYNYSITIKKYDQHSKQLENIDKQRTKLTKNILYELLSTENIFDYGLVTNFNFNYISKLNSDNINNSIQNAFFYNIINKKMSKNESNINITDIIYINKIEEEDINIKLVLKKENKLMKNFKNKFENDNYLNDDKIESSFNFYLINSFYKYLKQIKIEEGL